MSEANRQYWDVALRGLERFFDEGMTVWSKEKFYLLFPNKEIAKSEYVRDQLGILEKCGNILFIDTDEVYIKVLNM